ncbi:hypothetical protein FAGAP_1866 [Fusarium agapanthi]|uniref:Uncharacterized protein n=1 Tax=Fusarium agapanthi TaxID=1803897 RepID=A0A9P5BK73_9HYPO|nr:hypothetical protein FAGAP_1866 [Fusarium agapanthi]
MLCTIAPRLVWMRSSLEDMGVTRGSVQSLAPERGEYQNSESLRIISSTTTRVVMLAMPVREFGVQVVEVLINTNRDKMQGDSGPGEHGTIARPMTGYNLENLSIEQSVQRETIEITNRTPLDGMKIRTELQKLESSLRICHEDVALLQELNTELLPESNIPTLQDATIHAILAQSISGFADSIPLKSNSDIFPPEPISDINHMLQVTEAWIQTSEAALSFLTECKKETIKHITGSTEIMQSIDKGICAVCEEAEVDTYFVSTESQSRQFAESVKADILNLNKIWARESDQLKSEVNDLEDLIIVPDSSIKALEHDTEMVENRFVAAVMTQEVLERDEKPIGVLAAMLAKDNTLKVLEDIYQGQLLRGSEEYT